MKFSEEEKKKWLKTWRLSGKKAWAYAKENGLCPQTFVKWTKIRGGTESGLVEVPVKTIAFNTSQKEMVIEQGDMRIHIPLSIGKEELQAVFTTLRGAV